MPLTVHDRESYITPPPTSDLPPFYDRLRIQHQFVGESEINEPDWPFSDGDYRGEPAWKIDDIDEDLWHRLEFSPKKTLESELAGFEKTYADMILQLLHKQAGKPEPVIVLDVGGMLAKSWIRLATHFRSEIEAGKLVMMVNNLGRTPSEIIQRSEGFYYAKGPLANGPSPDTEWDRSGESESHPPHIAQDSIQFFKDNVNLIDARVGSLTDLFRSTINVNGVEYPILGNISLINDNDAVSRHSPVPSLDLPLLAALLSDVGVYISNTSNLEAVDMGLARNYQARHHELLRARTITQHDYNLESVNSIEGGDRELVGKRLRHCIMRKHHGPTVNVFFPN